MVTIAATARARSPDSVTVTHASVTAARRQTRAMLGEPWITRRAPWRANGGTTGGRPARAGRRGDFARVAGNGRRPALHCRTGGSTP